MAFQEHNPFETTLDKLSGSGAEQMKVPMRHLCHATKMLETRAGKKFCKLAGKMVDLAGNSLYYELLGSDEKDVKSKSRDLLASEFVVVKKLQLQKNQFWAGYHASFGEKGSRTTFHPQPASHATSMKLRTIYPQARVTSPTASRRSPSTCFLFFVFGKLLYSGQATTHMC